VINFRYHVVSLTAVFLALAIGLVVGTAALNGPVADSLKNTVTALRKDNQQLRDAVGSLQDEVNREEDFAAEAAPILLDGKLTGRRILIVTMPRGQEHADGVIEMLQMAGATVTGRIDVQDKFVNPDSNNDLLGLAARSAQPSVPAAGLPGNSNGAETCSAQLASALLDRPGSANEATEADRRAVLSAYSTNGFIVVDDRVTGPADTVVVVSGPAHVDGDSAAKDRAVVTVATQFDKAAPLVVAGSGAGDGNVVAAVRADPALAKTISTVDNANTSQGQVVTALATIEQVRLGQVGQYGLGAGATSLLPKLAG
jgi:Copper transport outer membrane protein, MctB